MALSNLVTGTPVSAQSGGTNPAMTTGTISPPSDCLLMVFGAIDGNINETISGITTTLANVGSWTYVQQNMSSFIGTTGFLAYAKVTGAPGSGTITVRDGGGTGAGDLIIVIPGWVTGHNVTTPFPQSIVTATGGVGSGTATATLGSTPASDSMVIATTVRASDNTNASQAMDPGAGFTEASQSYLWNGSWGFCNEVEVQYKNGGSPGSATTVTSITPSVGWTTIAFEIAAAPTTPVFVRGLPTTGTIGASLGVPLTQAFDATGCTALVVSVSYASGPGPTIGVTYNGVAMTKLISEKEDGSFNAGMVATFGMLSPPTGTHNIVVTPSSGSGDITMDAVGYSNVVGFGATAFDNANHVVANSPALSITIPATSVAVFTGAHGDNASAITGHTGTTLRVANAFSGTSSVGNLAIGEVAGTGSSISGAFDHASSDCWVLTAVELQSVSSSTLVDWGRAGTNATSSATMVASKGSINPTAGSTLIVSVLLDGTNVSGFNGENVGVAITDNIGDTGGTAWTKQAASDRGVVNAGQYFESVQIWTRKVGTTPGTGKTVTSTWTTVSHGTTTSTDFEAAIQVWEETNTTASVGASSGNTGRQAAGSTTINAALGTTPAAGSKIVTAVHGDNTATTATQPSGFVLDGTYMPPTWAAAPISFAHLESSPGSSTAVTWSGLDVASNYLAVAVELLQADLSGQTLPPDTRGAIPAAQLVPLVTTPVWRM